MGHNQGLFAPNLICSSLVINPGELSLQSRFSFPLQVFVFCREYGVFRFFPHQVGFSLLLLPETLEESGCSTCQMLSPTPSAQPTCPRNREAQLGLSWSPGPTGQPPCHDCYDPDSSNRKPGSVCTLLAVPQEPPHTLPQRSRPATVPQASFAHCPHFSHYSSGGCPMNGPISHEGQTAPSHTRALLPPSKLCSSS